MGSDKMSFMYKFFDENKEVKNNKILDTYDRFANMKVGEGEAEEKKDDKDDFAKV